MLISSIYFLAAACSIGVVLLSGCDTGRKPDISFESLSHEFPDFFIVGSKITHRFDFTNKGDAPLEIQDIQTNCGCVATKPTASQIPPGGTGTIHLEIDRDAGPFREQAFIYTNDPEKTMIPLVVSGVIKSAITYPKKIDIGQYERGQNVRETITLTNNTREAIKITAHTVSAESITVTLPDRVIRGGKRVNVEATLSFPAVGFYNEMLTLSVQSPEPLPGTDSETAELSVQFRGHIFGGIDVLPSNLFLGVMPRNRSVQRTLQLKTDGTHAFSVLGITADNFEVSVETTKGKQRSIELLFEVSAPSAPAGLVEGIITIETDHPDVSAIEIPVKGVVQ